MSELPDELLKEILEPAFAIPDALFRNPEGRSPFSTYVNNYKTSSLLLVNKNWCRVGTPLLYHDVILRSKAQARALAAAFKSNPDLARWVRKLRVEGGFGPSMQQILEKCGPKLTDVCLMTALYSDDSASGIVPCLSLLNPTTLVFLQSAEDRVRGNSNMDKLLAALFTTVPTWDNLVSRNDPIACQCVMTLCSVASIVETSAKTTSASSPKPFERGQRASRPSSYRQHR